MRIGIFLLLVHLQQALQVTLLDVLLNLLLDVFESSGSVECEIFGISLTAPVLVGTNRVESFVIFLLESSVTQRSESSDPSIGDGRHQLTPHCLMQFEAKHLFVLVGGVGAVVNNWLQDSSWLVGDGVFALGN